MKNTGINNALQIFKEDNLKEIVRNLSDAIVHSNFSDFAFFGSLPMVGLAFSTYGAIKGVRDIVYLNNVLRFIKEAEETTLGERNAFVNELQEEPKKFERLCVSSVALLSNFEDVRKATILGLIVKHRIKRKITTDEYLRLSHAISQIYVDDLEELTHFLFPTIPRPEHANLISSGLLYERGLNWNTSRSGEDRYIGHYELNRYGNLLHRILADENFYTDNLFD
jgi:hypothetical protein